MNIINKTLLIMSEQKLGYLTNTLLFGTTILSGLGVKYFVNLPETDGTLISGGILGIVCVASLLANVVDLTGFKCEGPEPEISFGLKFKEGIDLKNNVSNLNLSGDPLKKL